MLEETKKYLNSLTIGYIFALGMIAVLSMSAHMILDKVIGVQSTSGTVINVSGRQRMLSQRIAMLSCHYSMNQNEYNKQSLVDAISLMEKSHLALTKGDKGLGLPSTMPQNIYDIYFSSKYNLDQRLKDYFTQAKIFVTEPENKKLLENIVDKAHNSLLEDLDKVVKLYEVQSTEQVEMITFTQRIVLFIIIATLLAEAIFIFRPIVNKVKYFALLLFEFATHDYLTKFANRRLSLELLNKFISRNKIDNKPISIMMIDIDHFKNVNDTYGHKVGDDVLVMVSKLISDSVRPTDICGRWGGEEFLVILPDTDLEGSKVIAQRILSSINEKSISLKDTEIHVTISIGLSTFKGKESATSFIDRADSALYLAKDNGRNRIEIQ